MTAPDNELRDRSTGELLKQLSNETTTLVKQEIDLLKAELAEKAKPAGIGAGRRSERRLRSHLNRPWKA
jgi:hypothetical protein